MRLFLSLAQRGEQTFGDDALSPDSRDEAVDIRHVFFGRKIGDDVSCSIQVVDEQGVRRGLWLSTPRVQDEDFVQWRNTVTRPRRRTERHQAPLMADVARSGRVPRFLNITPKDTSNGTFSEATQINAALLPNGGLTSTSATVPEGVWPPSPILFLPTAGIDDVELARRFEDIVITPEEDIVTTALHTIEPGIERIVARQLSSPFDRGFVVGIKGMAEQVPLGGLGDGVHRMLAIAICLVAARGGYLLIDEIDTGLHHTVMRKMWALVFETAKRLDVSVFATTHSYDCVHALAAIARESEQGPGEVSLIRVERDNPQGIVFSENEIYHLADWDIEAR